MRFGMLVVLLGLGLVGCSKGEATASSTQQTPAPPTNNAPAVQSHEQAADPAPAPAPAHLYAMDENGEYGYESGISENARKDGQIASQIVMVKYRGLVQGYHTLIFKDNGVTTTLRCKEPCEFAKVSNAIGSITSDPKTIRLAESSLGWAMAQDAMNGVLQVYKKQ